MKKILALLVLFISACSNNNSVSEIPAEQIPMFNGLQAFSLPFNVDTNFILKADTAHKLSYTEVREMGQGFLAHESALDLYYSFNEFCKVDSLKKNNAYAAYVDSLGIGMTKDAIAYKLGYIIFKNHSSLLVWGINNLSYEACPVFSGTRIIGSYRHANGKYTHVLLGDRSFWADPPSTYEITLTTEIGSNEKFVTESFALTDDIDVPGEERTTTKLKFKIENGELKITNAFKEVKSTEDIKE